MSNFTQEILLALKPIANKEKASDKSKKVREQFDFLGIEPVAVRSVTYPIFDRNPPKNGDELINRVNELWNSPFRELQYITACDYLFRHRDLLGGQHLSALKKLIKTKSHYDTVDRLSSCILAALIGRLPALKQKIAIWIRDPNIWVRRSAILFQLQFREHTDWDMLRSFCSYCAKDEESCIKSAISKALREYAHINPQEVRKFVLSTQFSSQTTQEILKNL